MGVEAPRPTTNPRGSVEARGAAAFRSSRFGRCARTLRPAELLVVVCGIKGRVGGASGCGRVVGGMVSGFQRRRLRREARVDSPAWPRTSTPVVKAVDGFGGREHWLSYAGASSIFELRPIVVVGGSSVARVDVVVEGKSGSLSRSSASGNGSGVPGSFQIRLRYGAEVQHLWLCRHVCWCPKSLYGLK